MTESDHSEVFAAAVHAAVSYVSTEFLHRMKWCDGYRGCPEGMRKISGMTCGPCLDEIVRYKAAKLFSEWDALGLGYIGPRL